MTTVGTGRAERIRQTLEHLRNGTTDEVEAVLPFGPKEFTDPEIAHRERELIFGRVPNIVASSGELPKPHDFITRQMPRNRVVVIRQEDGSVKGFVNACRHRGAMIEERESGRCRLFSCAYHRWSYDPDGSLRTVTRGTSFGDFDQSEYGLLELPVEERHGLVWMVDRVGALIDVAAWLGPEMDAELGSYGLDKLVTFQFEGFDEPVNWKIMQDAFIDNYHIQYAHPNSAAKHVHTNVQTVEDFGRHARMTSARKSIDKWLDEDPGDRDLSKDVTDGHFLLPNSTLLRQPSDHYELLTFRPHPTDPGWCRMEMRLLVPTVEASGKEPAKWKRMWEKNWAILLQVLHEEDFPLLRDSQIAVSSADMAGMVLGRNEVVNQIFHREVRKLMAE